MNQSQLTTKEYDRKWKKVLSRKVSPNLPKKNLPVFKQQTILKVSPNLPKKNLPVFKQQTILIVVTMNSYELWPGNS
jgi:hypothetical protein